MGHFHSCPLPMINSYAKAFGQLNSPRFLKPMVYSLALAVLTSLAVLPAAYFGFEWLNELFLQWLEGGEAWWVTAIVWSLRVLEFLLLLTLLFFLFGAIQVAYLGLFIDGVVEAVIEKHYPNLAPNPPPSLPRTALASTRLLALSLVVNLLLLPIFIIGWFLPPMGLIIQLLANGYLLGREFEDATSPRLPDLPKLPMKEKTLFGSIAAALMLIPVVNFLAPVLAAAAMTHYLASRS